MKLLISAPFPILAPCWSYCQYYWLEEGKQTHYMSIVVAQQQYKVHIRARELGASRFKIKISKTKKISMHLGIRKTFMLVLIFFLIFLYLEQRYHNMYKSKISVLSHLIEYWMRKYLFILRHRFPGAQFKLISKLCEPWNNSL